MPPASKEEKQHREIIPTAERTLDSVAQKASAPPDLKLSVAMAVRNGERFLPDQLASVLRQTLLPNEFVVCDDASSDRTPEILTRFAQAAPFPVRIYRNEVRLGADDATMRAAHRCEGSVIAICNHDDVWLETKLERCI